MCLTNGGNLAQIILFTEADNIYVKKKKKKEAALCDDD